MDDIPVFWFFLAGVIALIAIVAIVNYYVEKKRTEGLKKLADDLGFEFFPKGDQKLFNVLQRFFLFTQGHSKKLYNLMEGNTKDLDVCIFDFRYVTGYGKHQQTWNQTVIFFESDDLDLPAFTMRPESFWHKIGSMFGYQDINFASHPRFSKTFLLRGPDEDDIRDTFTPEVLDYLEGCKGICIEADGPRFIFYRQSKRLKPEQVRSLLAEGFDVLGVFRPPEVEGA